MKKIIVTNIVLFMLTGLLIHAQHHHMGRDAGENDNPMMQKRMMSGNTMGMMGNMMCPVYMQNMMNNHMPMVKYMKMVNMVPVMQEELSLTDQQTEELLNLQTSFKKKQLDRRTELYKNRMNLMNLMSNDASNEEIRNQMQKCFNIRIEMQLSMYETAMKGKLSSMMIKTQYWQIC